MNKRFKSAIDAGDYNEAAVTILSLSEDVIITILMNLSIPDIISMCKVNVQFKQWCDHPQSSLWRNLFYRDFGAEKYRELKKLLGSDSNDKYIYMAQYQIQSYLEEKKSYIRPESIRPESIIIHYKKSKWLINIMIIDRREYGNRRLSIRATLFDQTMNTKMQIFRLFDSIFTNEENYMSISLRNIRNDRRIFEYDITNEPNWLNLLTIFCYQLSNNGFEIPFFDQGKCIDVKCFVCSKPAKFKSNETGELFCSKKCAE